MAYIQLYIPLRTPLSFLYATANEIWRFTYMVGPDTADSACAHTRVRTHLDKPEIFFLQIAAEIKSNIFFFHLCCLWAQSFGKCCEDALYYTDTNPESNLPQAPT